MSRVFVRGHYRSGTSIMARCLKIPEHIYITEELGIYDHILGKPPSKGLPIVIKRLTHTAKSHIGFYDPKEKVQEFTQLNNIRKDIELTQAMEKSLYHDCGYSMWGDKMPFPFPSAMESKLAKAGMDFKVVYIYRDGRDVISSRIRHNANNRKTKTSWSTTDPRQASDSWVDVLDYWDTFRAERRAPIEFIRFEDLVLQPDKVAAQLSNFLNIPEEVMLDSIQSKVDRTKDHIGYYQEWLPNWEEVFTPRALQRLKQLSYT